MSITTNCKYVELDSIKKEKIECPIVNSYNEWDPLEEVIVGDCLNFNTNKIDRSFKLFFYDNIYSWRSYARHQQDGKSLITKQYIEETQEDLEGLVKTFQKLNITVKRPMQLKEIVTFKTPYWKSVCTAPYSVRDQFLIIGNEIIETSPLQRCRYFENDLLKPIFYEYLRKDKRVKWTCSPRPMMLDSSYCTEYIEKDGVDVEKEYPKESTSYDFGYEIMFDGAQCIRFGEDIVMNVANENHELGRQWLQRHSGNKFRIHKVYITDNHIDSYVVPLKVGTLLIRNKNTIDKLPLPLQKWDKIYAPPVDERIFPIYDPDNIVLASKYIDTNVLSIDGDKIIVNEAYTDLIKELEKHKFTPIAVKLRHRRLFSGGFHCVTLDIRRRGNLEKYF